MDDFKKIQNKWVNDTALIAALVFIVLAYFYHIGFIFVAVIILCFLIITPSFLTPLGYIWYMFALLLSKVVGTLFFGFVFFVVILPIGIARRLMGKDDLLLRNWRSSKTSLIKRNHLFSKDNLERPY